MKRTHRRGFLRKGVVAARAAVPLPASEPSRSFGGRLPCANRNSRVAHTWRSRPCMRFSSSPGQQYAHIPTRRNVCATREVFRGRFGPEPPVRTTIAAAAGIPGNSLVEIIASPTSSGNRWDNYGGPCADFCFRLMRAVGVLMLPLIFTVRRQSDEEGNEDQGSVCARQCRRCVDRRASQSFRDDRD